MGNEQKMDNKLDVSKVEKPMTELEKALALVAELTAKNAETEKALYEAKQLADSKLRLAVGDSGGVSIYGLQQFPVTLTVERWHQCLDFMDKHLDKFIIQHKAEIETKTKARQAIREAERTQRQPRNLGNNGPVKTFSQDELSALNNKMNQ